jgi:hypothetical protein
MRSSNSRGLPTLCQSFLMVAVTNLKLMGNVGFVDTCLYAPTVGNLNPFVIGRGTGRSYQGLRHSHSRSASSGCFAKGTDRRSSFAVPPRSSLSTKKISLHTAQLSGTLSCPFREAAPSKDCSIVAMATPISTLPAPFWTAVIDDQQLKVSYQTDFYAPIIQLTNDHHGLPTSIFLVSQSGTGTHRSLTSICMSK